MSHPIHAEETTGVREDAIKIEVIEDITGPISHSLCSEVEATKICFRYINDDRGLRLYCEVSVQAGPWCGGIGRQKS